MFVDDLLTIVALQNDYKPIVSGDCALQLKSIHQEHFNRNLIAHKLIHNGSFQNSFVEFHNQPLSALMISQPIRQHKPYGL